MYPAVRRVLFRLDPERAHALVMGSLALASGSPLSLRLLERSYRVSDPRLAVDAFGLRFPSPIGLAAGLDKDAVAVSALAALGFGHLELGSVTARPQPGNPAPRLFRLLEDDALINRMGFNNRGSAALAHRLQALRRRAAVPVPLGVNVGKSRAAPLDAAVADFEVALRDVWAVADYLALNVSSPNTPGLRRLQARQPLEELLALVAGLRAELGPKPVLLKVSPDLTDADLTEVAEVAEAGGLAGLIATNTTVRRDGLRSARASEQGGLSGRPLTARSLEVLRLLRRATTLPLISVGGILTPADVVERLAAGASLVQVYTAFVYGGPGLVRELHRGLLAALERRALPNVAALSDRATPARPRPEPTSGR